MLLAAVLVALLGPADGARAANAWYEGFEGAKASWSDAGGDAQYRIDSHKRVQGEAHTGDGCERLSISGREGTHVYLSHDVGQPRVIPELSPSVWIKSDRPSLQILARVALPRTQDPRTGRPVSTLVLGTSYTKVGAWQQLRIDKIPQLLTRQIRALRMELGPSVDAREAYVENILLNVYGGPGVTNVWIDDLDVAGYVGLAADQSPTGESHSDWQPVRVPATEQAVTPLPPSQPASPNFTGDTGGSNARQVKLVGSVLLVDDKPVFPRAIQYRGESFARLKQLGFNTVWLGQPATSNMLAEARQHGLWLICPPPYPPQPEQVDPSAGPSPTIGSEYDVVLAWDLGWGLCERQLPETRLWAQQIRTADRGGARPLICRPESKLRGYSRYVDLLVVGRSPLGSSLELADYVKWIAQRPRLSRPGTPIWSTVQTQVATNLHQQWNAAGRGLSLPPTVNSEQVRVMVYAAVAAGSRGLLFESQYSLDATDPVSRNRAAALELLNLELDLINPWLAAGSLVATVDGSEPEVTGAVLRTDRARLLLPIWSGPGAQFVPGQSAGNRISFVVPGVPESNDAYEITPGGLKPLRRKRVTGGVRVTLEEFSLSSMVLLTQDPLVISSMSRRSASNERRAAELQRQLADWKSRMVEQVNGRLESRGITTFQAADRLTDARKSLQRCDGYLATGDTRTALLHARRAMRPLRMLERASWLAAVGPLGSPVASPATVCYTTLPWHADLITRISASRPGPNRLLGGEFENLDAMMSAGWHHYQHPSEGIRTEAELSPAAAHSGRLGLRLSAQPEQPDSSPILVEAPPVWIVSPGVSVEAGELVRIQGWVQVPKPLTGSVDGLMIVDSLGGEVLAERIAATTTWQPFTLYRVAPRSGQMTVSFYLSGLGEAWLDDITVQPLGSAAASVATGVLPVGR